MSQLKEENNSNLGHFVQGGIQALESLQNIVTEEQIENSALILAKSNVIYIAAQRRSFPIAAYLTYAFLTIFGVANMLLDSLEWIFAEHGKTVREGDVLLAISFPPYANEVLKLAGNAQERSIPVIVIADSILGPLGLFSDVYLEVKDQNLKNK